MALAERRGSGVREIPTSLGLNRRIGRVALAVFRVHFQSSLINAPLPGRAYTSSMELSRLDRLMYSRLCRPDCAAIFCLITGMKLARLTRTEYRSGRSVSNPTAP